MSANILIVEDEVDLIAPLEYALTREGYTVQTATSVEEAWPLLQQAPIPNALLLDLMLPGESGMDLCRKVRSSSRLQHLPIIMVTAKGEEIDRVVGFEMGADDYVVKPYSVRELILRTRALLRRNTPQHSSSASLEFGLLRLDTDAFGVFVADAEIKLTVLEFRLLHVLMDRKGRVQTRGMLLRDVWGMNEDLPTRTVDTHVKRLRQKLGPVADYIETIRGVGYRFLEAVPTQTTHS